MADVLDVVGQLAPSLKTGSLVLDCSTVSCSDGTARGPGWCAGKRISDCPVSGGVKARGCNAVIMAGGNPQAFERARPFLRHWARRSRFWPDRQRSGREGNQSNHVRGIIEAVAEAMAFAHAQGLPLTQLVDTLGKGAGSSWYFRAPRAQHDSRELSGGVKVRLHAKDLGICRDMAARFGVTLPVVERMLDVYSELITRGYGMKTSRRPYRLTEELFGA